MIPRPLPKALSFFYESQFPGRAGGMDEVGYGAWAGPVVCALVWVQSPEALEPILPWVRDSKKLTPLRRKAVVDFLIPLRGKALVWQWGFGSVEEIATHNILGATALSAQRAFEKLRDKPSHILVDGSRTFPGVACPMVPLVKGDTLSYTVALASILAKVLRDRWMNFLDYQWPGYNWSRNKGYGTLAHRQGLETYGLSPWHRPYRPLERFSKRPFRKLIV